MAEYIRKDILFEVLHEGREIMLQDSKGRTPVSLEKIIDFIKDLPTADVVEVVHGEWICLYDEVEGITDVTCSVCKSTREINGCYVTNDDESCYYEDDYCPNCGAKMDGKKVE